MTREEIEDAFKNKKLVRTNCKPSPEGFPVAGTVGYIIQTWPEFRLVRIDAQTNVHNYFFSELDLAEEDGAVSWDELELQ